MTDTYVSVGTAARRLSVSADSIRRWAKSGKIAAIRYPNGYLKISSRAIENILSATAATLSNRSIH